MNAIMTGFIYLFIYEKIAHPLICRKRKNNRPSDQ